MMIKWLRGSQKLKRRVDNHPVIIWAGVVLLILSALTTSGAAVVYIYSMARESLFWRSVEQDKISQLAPTQTAAYVNSILGEPITKQASDDMSRYIYKERGYWVTTYVDTYGTVQAIAITACGDDGFYPEVKGITLGSTKMVNAWGESTRWESSDASIKLHYFLRGASAPSYYYDEYVASGATNYQATIVGHNELCGYVVLPEDIDKALSERAGSEPLTDEQVHRIRTNVAINTIVVTAPSANLKIKSLENLGDSWPGPSYVDVNALSSLQKGGKAESTDKFNDTKDFDVVRINSSD